MKHVNYINRTLIECNKPLIYYQLIILGLTRASLLTNSFISAASFQNTTKVLMDNLNFANGVALDKESNFFLTKTTFFSQLSIFAKNVRCQDKGYDHLKFLPHELTLFIVCLTYLREAIFAI